MVGKPPFETSDVKKTYEKIRKNCINFPDHLFISDEAKDLIQWILNSDPEQRPTLHDILEHKFLSYETPVNLYPSLLACTPCSGLIQKYFPENIRSKKPEKKSPSNVHKNNHESESHLKTEKEALRDKILIIDNDENEKINQEIQLENNEQVEYQSSEDVPIHTKKWIDETSKYGLGYIVSKCRQILLFLIYSLIVVFLSRNA